MHPKIRQEVLKIYEEINEALTNPKVFCRFSQTLRTIEEQNELYAQGRTKKGKIVTNARGGSSYHNYGLAIDIVMIVDGKEASWDTTKDWDGDTIADWIEVVTIFKKYGWTWGGNFKSFKDYPHFEKNYNIPVSTLFDRYKKKQFLKGSNTYIEI